MYTEATTLPAGKKEHNVKSTLVDRFMKWSGAKWILLVIPLVYVGLTLIIPLVSILGKSFVSENGITLEYFQAALTQPLYQKVMWITLRTGLVVTLVAAFLAYPMAYMSVKAKKSVFRRIITGGVLIPYWVSMLVRIFAWQIILSNNGPVNSFLMKMNIVDQPVQILYTSTAIVISLTHVLLPYMFLSMQAVMEGIDSNLTLAAEGMGAKPVRNFFTVFFPLSIPGIVSGSMMVFVLALGFYIAPALLGGSDDMMMSNLIQSNMSNMNWNMAAALSVELVAVVLVLFGIAYHFVGDQLFNRKA
ncbi:MAG: ABC transporter permease [Lachnospiraceae bacterium]|nr:ABC transporter permease [Lachnospiraceae bacterium]